MKLREEEEAEKATALSLVQANRPRPYLCESPDITYDCITVTFKIPLRQSGRVEGEAEKLHEANLSHD